MALIQCKECGHEVSTTAKSCPNCGAKAPKFKWWLWLPIGLFAGFMLIGVIAGNSPEAEQKAKKRAVIDLCWSDQQRKSLTPGEQVTVAGVCEGLEREFLQTYGHKP